MTDRVKPKKPQPEQAERLEAALVIHRIKDEEEDPNRKFVDSVTLRESSRTAIVTAHSAFVDQHSGDIHHHAIKLSKIPRYSKAEGGGWAIKVPNHIWIDDDGDDEIGKLRDFLSVVRDDLPEEEGRYLVVSLEEGDGHATALQRLIGLASSTDKAEALAKSIETVSGDPEALELLATFAANNPQAIEIATAALNIAKYRTALERLQELSENDAGETAFQTHLEEHNWLFGTDYCEHVDLRRATRDEIQDFIVRRTTDNYIEIIEIKTPLGGLDLFRYDESHDSHYAGAALSKVVGQVVKYIEKLDANRHMLLAEDGIDVNKIRARIIIGRDGDKGQQSALRNHNGHYHRIEVMTFDQLIRIGERIVGHMESVIQSSGSQRPTSGAETTVEAFIGDADDIPF
jgi:hypothetical protein